MPRQSYMAISWPKSMRILRRSFLIPRLVYILTCLLSLVLIFLYSKDLNIWNNDQDKRTAKQMANNRGLTLQSKLDIESDLPETLGIAGVLNKHIWSFSCSISLEMLHEYPSFPVYPQHQTVSNTLNINTIYAAKMLSNSLGTRIFGFVRAPMNGSYRFLLSSTGCTELWLSKDMNSKNSQLMSRTEKCNHTSLIHSKIKNPGQISSEISMKSSQYYFIEVLHIGNHTLRISWKPPHSEYFEDISEKHIFLSTSEHLSLKELIKIIPLTRPVRGFKTGGSKESVLDNTKIFVSNVKYLKFNEVSLALPSCTYNPGYVGKRLLYQYQAVEKFVNPSHVYPEVRHPSIKDGKWIPWFPLNENDASNISQQYMKHLDLAYPGKFQLKKILNVEKKPNWRKDNTVFYKGDTKYGDRYLLELELRDVVNERDVILSEYVYQEFKTGKLCYPKDMQWNKTANVYLLLSARKQGLWLWHFIKNVERVYLKTKDENLFVVIYDYNSTDIDMEEELKKSYFKRYKILKGRDEKYSRTYSLNRAAGAVTDQHGIVFTLDLHLEIPSSFPNSVRKHCIKGKMVYTPILCRLSCGASPRYPSGSWDPWGYGMFGAYKSDWVRFGGFDEEKFKTKWGGEDWDIVDRAYKAGLEFERIKHADFYHYDHTRTNMWT